MITVLRRDILESDDENNTRFIAGIGWVSNDYLNIDEREDEE